MSGKDNSKSTEADSSHHAADLAGEVALHGAAHVAGHAVAGPVGGAVGGFASALFSFGTAGGKGDAPWDHWPKPESAPKTSDTVTVDRSGPSGPG